MAIWERMIEESRIEGVNHQKFYYRYHKELEALQRYALDRGEKGDRILLLRPSCTRGKEGFICQVRKKYSH